MQRNVVSPMLLIWIEIMAFLTHIEQAFKGICEELGISVPELHALRSLYDKDGVLVSALALSIGKPATSFTPIMDRLEHKGLVERRPNPADRRSVLVYLTPKGEAWRLPVLDVMGKVEVQMRGELPNWLHLGTPADEAALEAERESDYYDALHEAEAREEAAYYSNADEPMEIPF